MTLTAKAKEDFLEVFGVDEEDKSIALQYFQTKTEVERNALIIEWLDSLKIFINIKSKFGQRKQCERFSYTLRHFNSGFIFNSREDATMDAIKSANGIYNKVKQ